MQKNKIKIDLSRDDKMSKFSRTLLSKHYLINNETSPQQMFARSAENFCYGDYELAQRIYDYVSKGWANFSSPISSNSVAGKWKDGEFISKLKKKSKAMPISCFVQYVPDTIDGQIESAKELSWLSISGGGVGQVLGMRGITDKSPGAIPYFKTADSNIMYYHQAGTRRGSISGNLPISHPDIQEFIGVRNPTGGDINRKCLNSNICVTISDKFIHAYENDLEWNLICPNTKKTTETVSARDLWQTILETRFKTGEPYIHNIDESNRHFPKSMKSLGFNVKGTNICSEIVLLQDEDHTSVCCLSSLNLEYYDEWKDSTIVEDFTRFLDNVIQWFIDYAPPQLYKAIKAAKGSRDLGIGAMGWHYYLMKNNIPFESGGIGSAAQLSNTIFKNIKEHALSESRKLAKERGEPEYMKGTGLRNGHLLAIAPNANSGIILDTSASTELIKANIYTQRTRVGSHTIKNKYLGLVLQELSLSEKNPEQWLIDQWQDILMNDGSVQHLDYLTDHQKKVFKTANEVDQRYVIDQARIRQPHICQAQSTNLFFKAGVSKKYVNDVHKRAFSSDKSLPGGPLKTLYYCRTTKESKVEKVSGSIVRNELKDYETQSINNETETCLSCE